MGTLKNNDMMKPSPFNLKHKAGRTAIILLLPALISACTSLAGHKPQVDAAFENARFKPLASAKSSQPPSAWWTSFSSAQLNTLVEQALNDNPGLQATAARLRAAQASLDAAKAGLFPSFTLNAGRQKNTVKGVNLQGQANSNSGLFTSASLAATYEIDLWARVRNTARAADQQLQASRYELEAARISVAGELASTWVQWVAASQTIALLESELENFQTNLDLVELRFRQGIAAASDVLQQRQLIESAQGNLAQARASRDVLHNALSILIGQAPNTLTLTAETLPALPPIPATGIPAALLGRRPDVQQAWAQVLSADSAVAAAIANRLPQLSIRASFGDQARDTDLLFDNWVRNLSVNLVAPLFDGGARSAEVDRQRALLDQALAQYQAAALNALADVDNALVQETRQRETVESLQRQLALAEQSLKRLFAGYRNGSVDYLSILNAQQSTSQLRRNLVNAQQQWVGFRIALYRALSGSLPGKQTGTNQPELTEQS